MTIIAHIKVQTEWTSDDLAYATSFFEDVLGCERPTENLETLEEIRNAALGGSSNTGAKKHRMHLLELEGDSKAKLAKVYNELRLHFLRYFSISSENIQQLILLIFGSSYQDDEPTKFHLIKRRALNLKDQ